MNDSTILDTNSTKTAASVNSTTSSSSSSSSSMIADAVMNSSIFALAGQVFTSAASAYKSLPQPIQQCIELLPSVCMVVGTCMPYVPQYVTILRSKNHKGFSTYVCLVLLVANILRVAFYIGRKFDDTLLVQSIVMILFQILLLEVCLRVDKQSGVQTTKKRTIFTGICDLRNFWRWTDLTSYILFIVLLAILSCSSTWLLKDTSPSFVEVIGYCALISESVLALPQAINNFQNKSVEGMSISMVLMWLAGDMYKTAFFILTNSPKQFLLCGIVQITIDFIILTQVFVYNLSSNDATHRGQKNGSKSSYRPSKELVQLSGDC